jgi:endogenous inhibitor of DNA gyrase (YacG/DUF329 family)
MRKQCKQCEEAFDANDQFDMFCSKECKEEALADLDKGGWVHCSYTTDQPRKQFLLAYRDENGKTKYKPVIGKATDLV